MASLLKKFWGSNCSNLHGGARRRIQERWWRLIPDPLWKFMLRLSYSPDLIGPINPSLCLDFLAAVYFLTYFHLEARAHISSSVWLLWISMNPLSSRINLLSSSCGRKIKKNGTHRLGPLIQVPFFSGFLIHQGWNDSSESPRRYPGDRETGPMSTSLLPICPLVLILASWGPFPCPKHTFQQRGQNYPSALRIWREGPWIQRQRLALRQHIWPKIPSLS